MGFFVFAPLLASTLGNPPECAGCEASDGTDCTAPDIDIIAIETVLASGIIIIPEAAFSPDSGPCLNIRAVEIKSGVTGIDLDAFASSSITSVSIPASVTQIQNEAFFNTASLTSVTFAAGSLLQEIGSDAFRTSGLTSIEIPQSVTTIGEGGVSGNTFYDIRHLCRHVSVDCDFSLNVPKCRRVGVD